MSRSTGTMRRWSMAVAAAGALSQANGAHAQATAQKMDAEYTAQIKKYLSDPRISTELVDHLPASSTVPTPLKFLGHIVGAPGILDHAADIHRYLEAVSKAAPGRCCGRGRPSIGAGAGEGAVVSGDIRSGSLRQGGGRAHCGVYYGPGASHRHTAA